MAELSDELNELSAVIERVHTNLAVDEAAEASACNNRLLDVLIEAPPPEG